MKKLFGSRRRKLAAVLTVVALVAVGVAAAAWLVDSHRGSGVAKVGSLTAPTVTNPVSYSGSTGMCFPGGSCDIQILVSNSNNIALTLTGASQEGSVLISTDQPGCNNSNFTLGTTTVASPQTVPANTTNFPMTLTNMLNLSASSPSACQGANVSIQPGGGGNNGLLIGWSTP